MQYRNRKVQKRQICHNHNSSLISVDQTESVYPKCYFVFLIKFKNGIQNFMVRFRFYLYKKNEIQIIGYFFFYFIPNWKTNYLKRSRLTLRYFHKYGLHVTQEQVHVKSPDIFRCTMVTKNPLFRKQLMYFNVCILATTFILGEAFIVRCSPKVVPKFIHKFFKNRKSWFKI